ncbi:hypothetical protein NWE55_02065 [Myroides albus]|uniref:hypothetical protein n=1 Tax=Myroides albus TaxID=2562892 RepID=UPI002158FE35|nr:hypothetical protein [Myroides albus]UVD80100.1 hypothetical protein NWE55_02065 [Myroides albus]
MSFKLLAIRPCVDIDQTFLRNLTEGEIYSFCNDYKFLNSELKPALYNDQVFTIKYKQTVPDNLYTIQTAKKNININISAVVGKNGAGKSSLIELLLYTLFIVSDNLSLVDTDKFIESEDQEQAQYERKRYEKDLNQLKKGLKVDIYYLLNNNYYKLSINDGNSILESFSSLEKKASFKPDKITVQDYNAVNNFFYSIIVNYSFYAYNSNHSGIWLKSFFHKNDGYQMPLVINPFRDQGKVDINTETLLTNSRLLSNILSIPNYKKINYKSPIKNIELYINQEKYNNFLSNGKKRFSQNFIDKFRYSILSPLFNYMFKGNFQYPKIDTQIKELAEIYLINKIITIPTKYKTFEAFDKRIEKDKERINNYKITEKLANAFVEELCEDKSHITLKVRQTLNFLREDLYDLSFQDFSANKFDIKSVVKKMNQLRQQEWFTDPLDYLPPPFLISKIKFNDGSYFDDLSSGEKQKIYSLNSIIYHLRNLDSINKNKTRNLINNVSSYQSINLIFDEVELYYHPQYQKETIHSLLDLIRISNFKFIENINIIFLTHSPFILSDIPSQNTIQMTIDKKTGKSKMIKRKQQSFGANIHDLLANNFFLTGPLIGNLADKKIMELINNIKNQNITKNDKLLLQLIGDTFLKTSIELYSNKHDKNSDK